MGKVVLLGLLVAAACGRYGFDDEPPDAPPAPRLLTCGEAPRFSLGPTAVRDVAAVATSKGFALLTVDDAQALRGWSYEWNDNVLESGVNLAVDSGVTGAFGMSAVDDDVVVAAVHGAATTLGTTYYALDAQLAPRADPLVIDGRVIGAVPLAKNGQANELASIRYEGGDVAVGGVDMNGGELGARLHGVAAEIPSEIGIIPAGTGYAIAWVDTAASPNVTKLALLDEFYALVKGPMVVANTAGFDTIRPRIRWAPQSNTYAVTWFEKTPTGDDDVYVQVFDDKLQPRFPAKLVAPGAVRPKVATDGTGFYVAYVNVLPDPDRMEIARVTPEGELAIRSAAAVGGVPIGFAMVERAGQPVLVHAENNGTIDMWFDPLCP